LSFLNRIFKQKSEFALLLERILGFSPKRLHYYHQAFTHKSVIKDSKQENFESYERLEFLGDAILDSIVSTYLFNKFPFKDEGFLTQLRSRLVRRKTLNDLGYKIGLKELIESKLNRESKTIYGDALEALIGAIYLDKGYLMAESFVLNKLIATHINMEEVIITETDFKSRVLEWAQKNKKELTYSITEQEENKSKLFSAELLIEGTIKGKGTAISKKRAEQDAAEQFYIEIKE
jgi:ribonuclease III